MNFNGVQENIHPAYRRIHLYVFDRNLPQKQNVQQKVCLNNGFKAKIASTYRCIYRCMKPHTYGWVYPVGVTQVYGQYFLGGHYEIRKRTSLSC
jgi:hypothetical protein